MMKADHSGSSKFPAREHVSPALRVAAAWAWRIIVVVAAIALFFVLASPLKNVIVAFLLAVLISALVVPLVAWIKRRFHLGDSAAAAIGLLVGVAALAGLMTLAVGQIIQRMPAMISQTADGIDKLLTWVNTSLLQDSAAVNDFLDQLQNETVKLAKTNGSLLASEALQLASSAVGIASSALIMVFVLFFILKDGRSMWIWFVRLFPASARSQVHEAGIRGWVTLGSYMRTQVQVAGIDAAGIGLGAFFLGVPLALPITVLVFLASFVPIVGAFVSGAVAVFIALVNNGPTTALIMLLVVLAVQQLESNVLQPWLMSNAVSLHPVAVVLAVTGGSILMGISGALFAVPVLATVNAITLYLRGHDPIPGLAEDVNRAGGPPGQLEEQIAASYQKKVAAAKEPRKKKS